MGRYIARRLLLTIPLLLGITMITYALINLAPGDPISALIPPEDLMKLDKATLNALKEEYGLNKPIPVRYVIWLRELVLHGNLGYSIKDRRPVASVIAGRLPATLILMATAMTFSLVIGTSLGVLSALKQYSWADYILTVLAFIGVSVPNFFLALLVIFLFGVLLHAFPIGGMWTPGEPTGLNMDLVGHLVMPAITMGMLGLATYLRYARASVLDVLGSEYVMVARAKGLSERVVVMRHVMRNALLPLVTIFGLHIPGLLGILFIEYVFSWPGMGLLGVEALGGRDYPVQMGIALLSGVMVLAANLITDLAYAVVDPRVAYS